MAWSELHETFHTEVKIKRLSRLLDIPYAHAAGLMACLWAWATGHQRDGDLSKLTDEEIAADVCRWEGSTNGFVTYLQQCELLDTDKRIHNWDKRGVKYLESTRKRVSRLRRTVTLQKRYGNVLPTQPTQPNQPKDKDGGSAAVAAFTQHFTQALKTKTGAADPKLVKQAQGLVYPYLKQFPDGWEALTTEVDVLPRSWPPERYVAQVRVMVQQRTHERLKAMTEGVAKG